MAVLKDLIVHGSSRFLNKIYASQIQAESGIFNKLIAKDATMENATVVGLLDVQGQLHTNAWTNSNIATIDGSFYITPTISSAEGTASNISATTIQFVPRNNTFAVVSSLYYYDTSAHEGTWLKYSKVLVTGQVQLNGEWIPLGTILGYLNADGTATSLVIAGAEDNKHRASPVLAQLVANGVTTSTSLNYRNLKVSLYQRSSSSSNNADAYKYPLGIFMTAMGTNGKTFLDIYGGGNVLTTTYGGYADPNVRIGNLSGLPAVGNQTPVGWGIYTTNGYFKGTVAADNGYIGGASISNGVLTVPAANVSGELTAATINGSKITANTITASQIATNAITADELAANAVTSAKIKTGEVKATNIASNAVTADKLDATTINTSNKLTVGAMTTATQNNILNSNIQIGGINLLKNTDATTIAKTITIASTSSSNYSEGWTATVTRIAGENTYTVSFDAKASEDTGVNCYWYSPNTTTSSLSSTGQTSLSGDGSCGVTLTTEWKRYWVTWTQNDTVATDKHLIVCRLSKPSSGTKTVEVRAIKFEVGNKATAWSPAPEDVDVHKYVTDIDSNSGITIKALNGTTDTNTTTANYIKLNTSGLNIYKGGTSIASYGNTIRIGAETNKHITIDSNGMHIWTGAESIIGNEIGNFSSTIKIGSSLKRYIFIDNNAINICNQDITLARFGKTIRVGQIALMRMYSTFSESGIRINLFDGIAGTAGTTVSQFGGMTTNIITEIVNQKLSGNSFTYQLSQSPATNSFIDIYTSFQGGGTLPTPEYLNLFQKGVQKSVEIGGGTLTYNGNKIFSFTPSSTSSGESYQYEDPETGEIIVIEYSQETTTSKQYLDKIIYYVPQNNNTLKGGYITNGDRSNASIGVNTITNGIGLIASSNNQIVTGKYNIQDFNTKYAFIIGNGNSNQRLNAFSITWDGDVEIYKDSTDSDLDAAIIALGWGNEVIV